MANAIPTGDGRPFQPDGWTVIMGAASLPRHGMKGLEAVAIPDGPRWVRNQRPIHARVWARGYGPRDATQDELDRIPAFLDENSAGHAAVDRAMATEGGW